MPLCGVTGVRGDLNGDGSLDLAVVGTERSAYGTCPPRLGGVAILGVDLDGDGRLEASQGPLPCTGDAPCSAFATPDLNGDGVREIAVITFGGETGFWTRFYMVPDGAAGPRIAPIRVKPALPNAATGFEWAHSFGILAGVTCGSLAAEASFASWSAVPIGSRMPARHWTLRRQRYVFDGATIRAIGAQIVTKTRFVELPSREHFCGSGTSPLLLPAGQVIPPRINGAGIGGATRP
jgi:hypothetical protein